MPATALLRQLYANRESVIRATARQTPTGVGPGVFYGDQQTGPLPTPPGSESSYENQYLQLHSAASGGHPGGQKTSADAFTNLVSTYGGYHSSIDYHNAMTPPSSVSPRDSNQPGKSAPVLTSNGGYDYAPDPLRGQYATSAGDGVPATLPLKPQASYTATMHPSGSTTTEGGVTYSNLDQPQYSTATAAAAAGSQREEQHHPMDRSTLPAATGAHAGHRSPPATVRQPRERDPGDG